MKIDLSSLRPVELSDRARFDKVLKVMGSQSCEACFPNIFMYRKFVSSCRNIDRLWKWK